MIRPLRVLSVVVLSVAVAGPVAADETYTVDTAHSEVSFRIRHMVGRVRGSFADFTGTVNLDRQQPDRSKVEFRIKTASINTNNERRDNHLRSDDFFDVEKHPEIVFTSTRIVPNGEDLFDVHGRLTMRGVTRDIVLPVTYIGEARDGQGRNKVSWETSTTLNRKDYEIVWNRAMDAGGLVLGDEVEVNISLQAVGPPPTESR